LQLSAESIARSNTRTTDLPMLRSKRSLFIANAKQLVKVEISLSNENLTRIQLANRAEVSASTVNRFFRRIPIDRKHFVQICKTLKLDPHEIATGKDLKIPVLPDCFSDTTMMNFVGRDEALQNLHEFLEQDSQVAIFRGVSEFGQTELTVLFISEE
jgi:hypothetical protein